MHVKITVLPITLLRDYAHLPSSPSRPGDRRGRPGAAAPCRGPPEAAKLLPPFSAGLLSGQLSQRRRPRATPAAPEASPVPFSPITGGRDAARPRRAARRARLHRLRRVQVAPPSLPNPTYFLPRVTPLLGLAGT